MFIIDKVKGEHEYKDYQTPHEGKLRWAGSAAHKNPFTKSIFENQSITYIQLKGIYLKQDQRHFSQELGPLKSLVRHRFCLSHGLPIMHGSVGALTDGKSWTMTVCILRTGELVVPHIFAHIG